MRIFVLFITVFTAIFADELPEYYKGKIIDKNIEVFETKGGNKIAIRWLADSKENEGPLLVVLNGGHGRWGLIDGHITSSRLANTMATFADYRAFSLDMPSDEYKKDDRGGYGNEVYRMSARQIDDLKAVLSAVNRANAPVYAVMTSKSTISGVNIASSNMPNLKGVVLTATSADLTKMLPFVKVPMLWIHHRKDRCFDIGIERVRVMAKGTKGSSMIEVANEAAVSGKECAMTNYHGFPQRDLDIAKSIDAWIGGKAVPSVLQ